MRAAFGSAVCLFTLIGCASPPQPVASAATGTPATAIKETEDQRAQRLINHSIETGESIATAEGSKLICKQERVTNTRLKNRKICLTEAQWAERSSNAKEAFQDATKGGEALPPRGN